ncbi:unnamed protein product [Effrenium voratum]|uniref:Uncharacterized protein n=1 Tax=Effrenium voratum TaxID=2562239 RepID=A0AA36J361_9DINO|nr:unnamed protein product [Effrenium voratum]CAJ1421784.1 unnamed protein product [Effrenium voratum]
MLAVSALFLSVWLGAASSNCSSDATSVLQLRSNDTSEGVSVEAELAVGDVFAIYGGGKFCTDRGGNRRRRGNFDYMECDTDWVESWQTFRGMDQRESPTGWPSREAARRSTARTRLCPGGGRANLRASCAIVTLWAAGRSLAAMLVTWSAMGTGAAVAARCAALTEIKL